MYSAKNLLHARYLVILHAKRHDAKIRREIRLRRSNFQRGFRAKDFRRQNPVSIQRSFYDRGILAEDREQ